MKKNKNDDNLNSLISNELKLLKHSENIIKNYKTESNELVNSYITLSNQYKKLVKQLSKLIKISDVQQNSLYEQKLELEKMNKMKNEFLGMAAHDLRNPASILYILSKELLDNLPSNCGDEQKEIITIFYENSKLILDLLEDLLDISIIESGELKINFERKNFLYFLNKIIEHNSIISKNKNIDIILETNTEDFYMDFDKYKLKQAFDNILTNAIKYSPHNSMIKIIVNHDSKNAKIEIQDKGPGIKKNDIHKLFEAFSTLSTKTTSNEKSTGLGLAIAKKVIESHNGEIYVESIVGKGSSFYVIIPLNHN